MTACPRCTARGKTWQGDDPRCAFPAGTFISDNWNCATMAALRDVVEESGGFGIKPEVASAYCNDSTALVVAVDIGGADFLIMSWYKRRGRTAVAHLVGDEDLVELTVERAEECIAVLERKLLGVVPTPPEMRS